MEIGIDIGGTFTDAVLRGRDGSLRSLKVPSTPDDPARAVVHALDRLLGEGGAEDVRRFLHGTTVATNAILESTAAPVGLITTRGFADVIELGRMTRASNYDLLFGPQTPVALVPPERRMEVAERIGADGTVWEPLDETEVAEAARALEKAGAQAVGICFLFAFANPAHERRAREIVRATCPGLAVSLSSEVDPAPREYERTCATAFDAALKPVMSSYLGRIETILGGAGVGAPLQVMHSRGGLLGAAAARERPIRLTLSGPSAAAIGAAAVLREAGHSDGVSIDVGGTSADVAVIRGGAPALRMDGMIGTFPVRVPTADVLAVAAGGGSVAWIDDAGGLRVGPRSAGAAPGPACYRRGGTRPTVLDASVVLGLVDPARFAAGELPLDAEAAAAAIEREVAGPLGLGVREAAVAIHRIINATMAEAVRAVTVARGVDPRELPLVAAGGGGGLHAAAIAEDLGQTRIVIPAAPGVLAATGLLDAPLEHDAARGFGCLLDELPESDLRAAIAALAEETGAAMTAEGVGPAEAELVLTASASFVGQGHNLEVPLPPEGPEPRAAIRDGFIALHRATYGHAREAPVRLISLRAVRRLRAAPVAPRAAAGGRAQRTGRRAVIGGLAGEVAVVPRAALRPGEVLPGPAIIEQDDTTVVVPAGWCVTAGPAHLLMERAP
ncbi:hydantoinase/oxoprolinase family protein [Roseomonas populi]|uniref:Hydantoinase/oxoprolinase family protein n=1 Tax=Roseomonas populi TaxID=3121582 RepID=A0ABT1XC51_9PROT|nr:hydantoinase/oxoprolinase family protein [Roseomonas pecuniae]MCR0985703.1 hydantoinase/oxoprolinase family protein [Roseomonas pecuniae]